jgi:hypothetical protein
MICAVTIRHIKAGSYDAFRAAWEPQPWPEQIRRVMIARNEQDADQVLTATILDIPADELESLRDHPDLLAAEDHRLAAIAPFEESVVLKGLYEVVEDFEPRAT